LLAVKAIRKPETGRIIRPPRLCGGHVWLDTCDADGDLRQYIIARSAGTEYYRSARKSHLGDVLLLPDSTIKHKAMSVTKQWEDAAEALKRPVSMDDDDLPGDLLDERDMRDLPARKGGSAKATIKFRGGSGRGVPTPKGKARRK
jgi:hypothetical protein